MPVRMDVIDQAQVNIQFALNLFTSYNGAFSHLIFIAQRLCVGRERHIFLIVVLRLC